MPYARSFQFPETAPRDGSVIEVRHGTGQAISVARWSRINQAFIDLDDPLRHTIGGVTGWRSLVMPYGAGADAISAHHTTGGLAKLTA